VAYEFKINNTPVLESFRAIVFGSRFGSRNACASQGLRNGNSRQTQLAYKTAVGKSLFYKFSIFKF
jgi:hypothetical protein